MEELLRMLEGDDDERWLALYKMKNVDLNLIKPLIPKVIEILKEKKIVRRMAFDLLLKISEEKPEILLDHVEDLKRILGKGFESVYSSILLVNVAKVYPDIVDDETVEKMFEMVRCKEIRAHVLSALSELCSVKPEALIDYIPNLIDLIKDREFEVRWNAAKILLNKALRMSVKDYIDEIRIIAKDKNLKPSVRVVAYLILDELE